MLESNINSQVRTALQGLLRSRFPQAVLLVGASEPLREQLAYEIAQALLCTGASVPCGTCNACHKMAHHTHPDCLLAQPEKPGAWKMPEIRALRQQVSVKPNDGARKVILLHDVNLLSVPCQNALLKTLEEPPAFAFFVLTCPQTDGLLETVRSRCVTFRLAPDSSDPSVDLPSLTPFLRALAQADECALRIATQAWEKLDKPTLRALLLQLQTALRDAVLGDSLPPLLPQYADETRRVHARIPAQKLISLGEHCTLLYQRTETNANATLQCAVLCAGAYGICFGDK